MRPLQEHAYKNYYKDYGIKYSENFIDFKQHFRQDNTVIEIGFGMGDATIKIAESHPGIAYLAIEVHKAGIGKLLGEIHEKELKNLKVIEYDAVEIFKHMIPDNSLTGVHIFFPDPWPKKRHHKRRLIKEEFITLITKKLKPAGYIYIVTDWEDYAEQILEVMNNVPSVKNKYPAFAEKQPDRPTTKFEKKGLDKKHKIKEIYFIKK